MAALYHHNAYFAHPENLLLAMMTDHRPHKYEKWAELHITVDKYGGSRYVGDYNCHLPKISLPHTGCGKTRQAGDRGGDSCLWTEFARWLQPCTRGFSTLMPTFESNVTSLTSLCNCL